MEEFDLTLANLDKNMVVEASAGTGKTYSLEHLVVRYIAEKGYDISEILVVTFTKKATFELENRIRTLIKNKVLEMDTVGNREYAKRLKNAFSCFAESQIYTIHGFCQYCIHNFPFESGVSFRASVMNSNDLYKEAALDYLRKAEYSELSDFYLSFRKKYKDISEIIKLFFSMIESRYVFTKNEVIPDQKIIDKTEKYCFDFLSGKGELYNAIKQLSKCDFSPFAMQELSKKMTLKYRGSTFEKLSKALELFLNAKTAGEVFSDAFLKDDSGKNAEKLKKYSFDWLMENKDASALDAKELFLTKTLSAIFKALELFEDNGNNKYIFHDIASYIYTKKAYLKIIELAEQKKKNAAMFDFHDLIELTRNAVTKDNGNSALANELRRKYKVVLIDEFQDTDISQWEIFNTIFRGDKGAIVLIGDPKQSIYRFRGGDLEVYFEAVNNLPQASAYRLATCYRSTENIVRGINDIFSKVFLYASSGGHKVTYSNVKSCKDNPKHKIENNSLESIIELFAIENEETENSRKDIEPIIENIYGNEIIKLLNQGVSPSSIAILMETNNNCQSMLEHLKKLGIPVLYEGELNIFDSCEAYQFVDLLYALSYPNDMATVRKSLFSEFFALSAEDIIKIENSLYMDHIADIFVQWSEKTAKGKLYEVLDEIFYKNNPIISLLSENKDINKDKSRPYITRTLDELGGRRKAANVMQLFELLIVKNMSEKQNASSLLRYMISIMKEYEHIDKKNLRLENEPDCVRIMTIHGSKGREFPIVFFLGGLGDSSHSLARENYYEFIENGKRYIDFSKSSFGKEKEFLERWEEKKRLYYVAMTRASYKLYIPIIKNIKGTDLVSFYLSLVFDKLSDDFEKEGIILSIPIMETGYNPLLCNRIFELIEEFCNGKQYFKFHKIKSSDFYNNTILNIYNGNEPDNFTEEEMASNLSCNEPSYKKEDAEKGFYLYSYSMLAKSRSHIPLHDTEVRSLEEAEKEPETEYEDELETEENIGIKGADFGNIMHKLIETVSFSKVMQHKDADSAIADNELLDLAEQCARGFVNSDLAFKSRILAVKLLYKTLATPVNAGGIFIRIGDISESDRMHELDFMFKIKQGKLNGKGLDNFILENGFIKGFIDMIFRLNGRYYIVDWKTNFLGTSLNDYNQANLENAMIGNNYKLQMQLYTIALDLMIRKGSDSNFMEITESPGDERDENNHQPVIGGCFYLFLRGLPGEAKIKAGSGAENNYDCPGVYFSPPDYDSINEFKKTFLENC